MTDKDIKDYCKYCSVEPPAMRFKCPECKHNPDKEQEYEELKAYAQRQENQRETYYKEYLKLSQECEKLKSKVEQLTVLGIDLNQSNEILRKSFFTADKNKDNWRERAEKYKQALEEIEKYTKKYFCENCEDFNTPEYSSHCEFCEYQEYFDIINKAKGGV